VRRGALGKALRLLLAAGVFTTAARADTANETASGDFAEIPCLEKAAVVSYLHRFQDQVMKGWVVPEDTLSDQTIAVRFRFSEDGNVAAWKLHSWTSHRVANSVELAFRSTTSPGPIPESAACLIGRMVEMHFENPY